MKRENVKTVALAMVREAGLINLSRRELCDRAGIPDGSFPHVMGCNFCEFVEELKGEKIDEIAFPVSKTRVVSPTLRRAQILQAAMAVAVKVGYQKATRGMIASEAGITGGLITHYFGTMTQLKRALMRAAIQNETLEIIAQGLANGDDHARKAPAELKTKAATLLANA